MPMRRRLCMATGWIVTVAALAASAQQQPSPVPGTFRSTVTLVPVDVRVLDRDGHAITDLTQEDFTLLENGVAQPIRQFARHTFDGLAAAPSQEPGAPSALPVQKHRTFLILFGRGRHHHPAKGVEATIRFVRERLLPQDQVAVFAYNRATDFTTNHAEVVKLLDAFGKRHESIESKLALRFSGLAGVFGTRMLPEKVKVEIDEVFKVAGAPGFRTVPPGRVTDSGRIADDVRRATQTILHGDLTNSSERVPLFDLPLDEYISNNAGTMADLENLYTGIEYLRYLEGEKHLIYITERGLFLPRVEDDHSIAAMANDARVVLHTVQTGGMPAGTALLPGPTFTEMFAMQTLRTMSELTGGHASIHAYADKALDRVDRTSRSQYLLGYAPPSTVWDGRYQRIDVKVKRRDATVLYRRGYYTRAQLVPYNRREFLTYSRVSAAALYPDQIRDIKVKMKASYVAGPQRGGEVIGEATIDIAPLMLEILKDGRREGEIDVAFFCHDADGISVGERWEKMTLVLTPEDYKRVRRDGATHTMSIPVRSSPRTVKVVVYDYIGDVIGSADRRLF